MIGVGKSKPNSLLCAWDTSENEVANINGWGNKWGKYNKNKAGGGGRDASDIKQDSIQKAVSDTKNGGLTALANESPEISVNWISDERWIF